MMSKPCPTTARQPRVTCAARMTRISFWVGFVMVLFVADASAYIDPGTGSYILQLLLAGLLGAAYVLKVYWLKVVYFFRNVFFRSQKDKQ